MITRSEPIVMSVERELAFAGSEKCLDGLKALHVIARAKIRGIDGAKGEDVLHIEFLA